MTTTVYRIRRPDTGQFYTGGANGHWHESGATYETKSACKCVWSHRRRRVNRGWCYSPLPDGVKAEIVEYVVSETAGATEAME